MYIVYIPVGLVGDFPAIGWANNELAGVANYLRNVHMIKGV